MKVVVLLVAPRFEEILWINKNVWQFKYIHPRLIIFFGTKIGTYLKKYLYLDFQTHPIY